MTNKFEFWCPLGIIEKSTENIDPTATEQQMVLGGIASTIDADTDGEMLDPNGFDIAPLMKTGVVNWHHQAKGQPKTIIGEPIKGEIRPEGLYIETSLYPSSQIARDVYELAQTLSTDSSTRRLGYSIEGKVIKRKSDKPSSPDYKKISKAIITGVAITHMPKNSKTFANIIKGEIDDEDNSSVEIDEKENTKKEAKKSMNTENSSAVMPESVDGVKPQGFDSKQYTEEKCNNANGGETKNFELTKAQITEKILLEFPNVNSDSVEKIYNYTLNTVNMSNRKEITDEDIAKACDSLKLDIAKTEDAKESKEEKVEKCDDANGGKTEKKEIKKSKKEIEVEDKDDNDEEKEFEKEVKKSLDVNEIIKAIDSSNALNAEMFKAVGTLVKDCRNALDAAEKRHEEDANLIKSLSDEIGAMNERVEAWGEMTSGRKSISAAAEVSRNFAKSDEGNSLGGYNQTSSNAVNITNKSAIGEILDNATFAKGYDAEYSDACIRFEQTGSLPSNIVARVKREFGIDIVK